MIRLLYRNNTAGVIVCCDACGDMIGEANDGAVIFDASVLKENTKIDVLHVHKGKCLELAQKNIPLVGHHELSHHLLTACINTCIDGDAFISYVREQLARRDANR